MSGEFFDDGGVEFFNGSHHAHIIGGEEVDGDTFASKSTAATNAVDIIFFVQGDVVVDDK